MSSNEWNPHLVKCRSCLTVIYSSFPGEFVTCKCFRNEADNQGIAIDETPYYSRRIGPPSSFLDCGRLYSKDPNQEGPEDQDSEPNRVP